jgi:fatty-acid peroxygenase
MRSIPRASGFDNSLAFLSEGYLFIGNRCRRLDADIFETRLLLSKVICMQGPKASEVFFAPGRFTRVGALPLTSLMSLQDTNSVATLDGEPHRWRKQMFMSLMTPDSLARMSASFEAQWLDQLPRWERTGEFPLFPEVGAILLRAVCAWAGIPLDESEVRRRTREIRAMIDGSGSAGPRNWRGLLLRSGTERWARNMIGLVRDGRLPDAEQRPLGTVSLHRDADGRLLDSKTAAVEFLNLVRPAVANDRFIVFAAMALHEHPHWREKLRGGDERDLTAFVQEVRRLCPFFPAIAGRVMEEFEWRGHLFEKGTWVLLDVFGTNRDPRSWTDPQAFRPERFYGGDVISPYNFIPQGGGDFLSNHRCAGEWMTIEIMRKALRLLTSSISYDVPPQDLSISLSRIPAILKSRFVISNVRRLS